MDKTASKFVEISRDIIEKIKKGELQPGEKTPSENEIIKQYNVSNTTARKSLQEIESKGWAKRIKGKGTFVLNNTADHHLERTLGSIDTSRRGFDENLRAEGFTPKNVIIEKTVLQDGISTEISGKHYMIDGPVLKIHQLRYADEMLVKDETRYISLELCPQIHLMPTEKIFLKTYEEHYHLHITEVRQTLSVEIFEPGKAGNYFDVNAAIPVFKLNGAVCCDPDKVLEVELSYYRGDKYKFAIIANPELTKG